MATSYVQDPAPKLTPVLEGNKVVFARDEDLVDVPSDDEESADDADAGVDLPDHADLKADWVDFAVSRGMDRNEAEAKTKQQLVDEFGG